MRKTPKKNVSKYSGVETRAIELLSEYSQGSIDNDLFGEQMENVAKEFHTLMKDESRAYVFDKDTPGWLNLFLGNKFSRWNHVRKLINASKDNPEITSSSEWTNFCKPSGVKPSAIIVLIDAQKSALFILFLYCFQFAKLRLFS